ncbi:unnamed protein product [Bursaphelenchus okinawaensis]|uniref:Uncharacterized protein n=1 Tax=Bursaphelenchus okinawaensis TaxID=465554 RepID=A0A811K1Z1_9BILA|nr:unnamed protein product [Bursaphelenchus okinawaensis]CAG9090143.1 unnamed protein product [Bursaphelenchus okinawaensis]
MKLFAVVLLSLVALNAVQAGVDEDLRDSYIKFLGANNIKIDQAEAHRRLLAYKKESIDLANKYGIYDHIDELLSKTTELIIAASKAKVLFGSEYNKAVVAFHVLRNTLADHAHELEMIHVDFNNDLLASMAHDPTNNMGVKLLLAVNDEAKQLKYSLNYTAPVLRNIAANLVLEAYQVSIGKNITPVHELAQTISQRQRIDLEHPLSSGLRHYVESLQALFMKIYFGNSLDEYVGTPVLGKLMKTLRYAKYLQDDSILDGITGPALAIFESLVDNLMDLKKQIRH